MKENSDSHLIPALTGLRFIAASLVCLAHTFPYIVPGMFPTLTEMASEGMTLFFVLSGFVIHYNYSQAIKTNPKLNIWNFFVARFARIYPLYILCLLLDWAHHFGYQTLSETSIDTIPFYLTLTQSWFYHPVGGHSLIYQFGLMPAIAWSVSTEWFFYLVYPFICLKLLKQEKFKNTIILCALFSIFFLSLVVILHFKDPIINNFATNHWGEIADKYQNPQDCFSRWLIYFSPYSRIGEFILGCLTASLYLQLKDHKKTKYENLLGKVILIGTLVSIIFIHHITFTPHLSLMFSWTLKLHQSFGFALPFAVVIFCCCRYQNFFTQFLSNRFMQRGGEISYSLYLLHLPIGEAFSRDAASVTSWQVALADYSRLVIVIFAILGSATVSYHFIEMPARKFIKRLLSPSTTSTRKDPVTVVNSA